MRKQQGLLHKRISEAHSSKLNSAWIGLLNFCAVWGLPSPDLLEDDVRSMGLVVAAYIQHLYSSGRPFSHGKMAVLSVQNKYRHLRRQLQLPWDFLSTWALELPLTMRRPAPVKLIWAIFAVSVLSGLELGGRVGFDWIAFGIEVICGFFGLMRPNEFLSLRNGMVIFHEGSQGQKMLVKVCQPKNRRAMGKNQIIVINNAVCVRWMKWLLTSCRDKQLLLAGGRHKFSCLLRDALEAIGLPPTFLVPASLRAGGATYMYLEGLEVNRLRLAGRWKCVNSLEHYIQEAASTLVDMEMPAAIQARIAVLLNQTGFLRRPPNFPLHKR